MHSSNGTQSITGESEAARDSEYRVLEGHEVSLSRGLGILARYRRKIIRNVLIAIAVSVPSVFLLPVKYKGEAAILTPQQPQSSLSAMAQLAGFGAGVPSLSLLTGFGLRNPAELYIGILKSRTIADDLVQKYNLKQVYGESYITNARKHLARNTSIESSKDSLIHIRVEDRDPKRAADLANSYVDELFQQNVRLALTEASQRRTFFEVELAKEKNALADAEIALKNTEQATGLVMPSGQAEALIRSGAQLRAEILSREAQMEGMKAYATDSNPRLQILKRELAALRSELSNVEEGGRKTGVLDLPTGQLPEASLKYLRKFRDLKYHETLFEILSKQYEAARLDESKAAPLIQIVDRADVPEKRSWPPRTILIVSFAMLVAVISTFFYLYTGQTEN